MKCGKTVLFWSGEILAWPGRLALEGLRSLGVAVLFVLRIVVCTLTPPVYGRQWLRALYETGYASLPVVGLTALFSGMVLALQSYTGFSRFSAEGSIATVVVLSMTRELGPVVGGLMVAGRVASSVAAEVGTMRVSEQTDALIVMGVDPFRFLVVPRLVAGLVTLPLLVLVADVAGVMGGYGVAITRLRMNSGHYLHQTMQYLETMDVVSGLVKASVFGGIMTLTGAFTGLNARQGAQGVGQATTRAVVVASILILLSNWVLTVLFFDTASPVSPF